MSQQLLYKKFPSTHVQFFNAYKTLSQNQNHHILLESGRGGKYSIFGINPKTIFKAKDNGLEIIEKDSTVFKEGDPLLELYSYIEPYKQKTVEGLPDFQGGVLGFISYDYARKIEKLPTISDNDLNVPELYFYLFEQWAVFDHEEKQAWIMTLTSQSEEAALQSMQNWHDAFVEVKNEFVHGTTASSINEASDSISVSMNEDQFTNAVEKTQHYIAQGDVFQVNLSVRQSQRLKTAAFSVYESLRILNPSPYMSYIQSPDFQIVSGSPELLVKKKGDEVSTRPIAGTRSRGKDEEEDETLANELIQNEKERAEHVMLVDLERNDLGRVCRYGTVEVNEFMVIEKYSHVMHIVSNVKGTLDPSKTGADVIRAVFPGGTITGAPKIRTMEIIEELEPVRRGLYTGSIGWIGFNEDMELNIVIRTMYVQEGMGHIQAGAGIVIDSEPKNEYKESLKKAKALWVAKELAEQKERHL